MSDFSKAYFFSGILSAQRSETTNRSLKKMLCATADLCNFYNIFCDVVSEWRSKENGEDHVAKVRQRWSFNRYIC